MNVRADYVSTIYDEEDLSTADYAYYVDVMARVQKKLLEV